MLALKAPVRPISTSSTNAALRKISPFSSETMPTGNLLDGAPRRLKRIVRLALLDFLLEPLAVCALAFARTEEDPAPKGYELMAS
jgi:hypothetical protein